jgi:hypothetical protein
VTACAHIPKADEGRLHRIACRLGVAERRIVHALGRSDIADDGFADMNPEPREEGRQAFGFEFGVQSLAGGLGAKRRPAGVRDMVRLWIGGVPEHHDRVADDLVDRAALGEERFRQRGEIPRGLPHQHIGIGRLRDRGKSLDVGKDQRNLLFDAAERGRDGIVDDPADDLVGNESRERRYRSLREEQRLVPSVRSARAS